MLTASLFLLASSALPAQEPPQELWSERYDGTAEGYARLGWDVVTIPDLNGDGSDEFAASEYYEWAGVYDGRTRTLLTELRPDPSWHRYAGYGRVLGSPGDLNGDGIADLVASVGDLDLVRASAGPYFHPLWTIATACEEIVALGDVTGDGRAEVVIEAGGVVAARSGVDGSLLWDVSNGLLSYGRALTAIADLDGDGFRDLVIATGAAGRPLEVRSGATGATIASWAPSGSSNQAGWGRDLVNVGDLDGDGLDEIVVGDEDEIWLLRGADGSLMRRTRVDFEWPGLAFGGDFDDDGDPEVVLQGAVSVEYWSVMAGQIEASALPWYYAWQNPLRLATGGDVHADGRTDLVVGEPDAYRGYIEDGRVRLVGVPAASLEVVRAEVGRRGRLTITGAAARTQLAVLASLAGGGPGSVSGVDVLLTPPVELAGLVQTSSSGSVDVAFTVPSGLAGQRVWVQAVDLASGAVTTMHTVVVR